MLVLLLQTNTNLEEKIDIKDADIKRYQIPIKLLRPKTALDLRDKNTEKKLKIETFDTSYFIDKSYFDDEGSQNYLMFRILFKSFKRSVRSRYHNSCYTRQ